jgi:hypothetical protein
MASYSLDGMQAGTILRRALSPVAVMLRYPEARHCEAYSICDDQSDRDDGIVIDGRISVDQK